MTVTLNGKPRKQLSDQLDRLDGVIDLLADNLNQAVADACRDGAKTAVREAIVEVLTDPALRALLNRPTPPEAAPRLPAISAAWGRLKAGLARLRARASGLVRSAAAAVAGKALSARPAVALATAAFGLAWRMKAGLLVAAGIGLVTAAACYAASHTVAAVAAGAGGAVAALAVQTGLWLRAAAGRWRPG